MKILLVRVNDPQRRGFTDSRLVKLWRGLRRKGHKVDCLTIPTRFRGKRFQKLRILLRSIKYVLQYLRGYEVIHLVEAFPVAFLPFLLSRKPKVFDMRSYWTRLQRIAKKNRLRIWFAETVLRILVRRCNHTITVDEHLARDIRRLKPRRLSILYNYPEAFAFRHSKTRSNDAPYTFGYIGVVHPQRGITDLLTAWFAFTMNTQEPHQLKILPLQTEGNAFYEDVVLPIARYLPNVELLSLLDYTEIHKFYEQLDVAIVPNYGDHLPLKFGEAIASRTPTLARYGKMRIHHFGHKGIMYFGENLLDWIVGVTESINVLRKEISNRQVPFWEQELEKLEAIYEGLKC